MAVAFFRGIERDIQTLQQHSLGTGIKDVLVGAVALRILGILAMSFSVGIVLSSITLLAMGSLGGILPIVMGIFLAVIAHDVAVVGHNRGNICHAGIKGQCALALASKGLQAVWQEAVDAFTGTSSELSGERIVKRIEFDGTWLFKHFV